MFFNNIQMIQVDLLILRHKVPNKKKKARCLLEELDRFPLRLLIIFVPKSQEQQFPLEFLCFLLCTSRWQSDFPLRDCRSSVTVSVHS